MKIKIFCVGGTIDKVYFDAKSKYEVGEPNIDRVLKELNVNFQYEINSLLKKDSLEMTDEDRKQIRANIAAEANEKIIITHGTDTMVQTAKELCNIKNKVIVITGAMEPAMFKTSDAIFNIGCAVAAVQSLKPGVYITMNGRVFNPKKVVKNVEAGRFEDL